MLPCLATCCRRSAGEPPQRCAQFARWTRLPSGHQGARRAAAAAARAALSQRSSSGATRTLSTVGRRTSLVGSAMLSPEMFGQTIYQIRRGKDDRVSANATAVVPSYKTGDRSSGAAVLDSAQSSSSGRSATQPAPHNDLKARTSPRHRSILACLDADPPADLLPSVLTLALIPLSASSFTIVVMAMPCGSRLSTTSSSSLKNTSVGGSQAVENMSVNEIACGSYLGTRSGRR